MNEWSEVWRDTLVRAEPFVDFLKRGHFFSQPYHGSIDALVTSDPTFAMQSSTGHEWEGFSNWTDLWDELPAPEVNYEQAISDELDKVQYFEYEAGNYHGADIKLLIGNHMVFEDQMWGFVLQAFKCYANDSFPDLMEKNDACLYARWLSLWLVGHAGRGQDFGFLEFLSLCGMPACAHIPPGLVPLLPLSVLRRENRCLLADREDA